MQTVNRERRVFLNRLGLTAFVAGLDYVLPGAALARADAAPEALGVDSAAVRVFLDAVAAST
ncbi:MAG: hypothetical protein IJI03_19585, partial [Rudaea sp.]|nr:hypothetical protein [Rudaea sp.]